MAELLSQLPPEMDVENLVLAASNQDQEEEEEGSGANGAGGWRGAGTVGVQAGRQARQAGVWGCCRAGGVTGARMWLS